VSFADRVVANVVTSDEAWVRVTRSHRSTAESAFPVDIVDFVDLLRGHRVSSLPYATPRMAPYRSTMSTRSTSVGIEHPPVFRTPALRW
jgi:hypothetical protein